MAITLSRLAVRSAMRIMLIAVCVVLIRVGMMSEPNPAALAIGVAIGGMSAMTSQAVCNVVYRRQRRGLVECIAIIVTCAAAPAYYWPRSSDEVSALYSVAHMTVAFVMPGFIAAVSAIAVACLARNRIGSVRSMDFVVVSTTVAMAVYVFAELGDAMAPWQGALACSYFAARSLWMDTKGKRVAMLLALVYVACIFIVRLVSDLSAGGQVDGYTSDVVFATVGQVLGYLSVLVLRQE